MGILTKCVNPRCGRLAEQNYCCGGCSEADGSLTAEENFLGHGRTAWRHSAMCEERRARLAKTTGAGAA
jgi:hypothetical protein